MLEVEAKFQLPLNPDLIGTTSPQVFDQICSQQQVAGYTLSDRTNTPQQDTYFDTTTGLLLRQGASLRLRKQLKGKLPSSAIGEGTQLVTFKTQTQAGYERQNSATSYKMNSTRQFTARTEFETPITAGQARAILNGNLEKVHVEPIQAARGYLKGEKIFPVLHVENIRETWQVNSDAGRVEVCLDEVRYAAPFESRGNQGLDKTQSTQEYGIELELKEGNAGLLQQIVDSLSQQYDLLPTCQSKYERGAALLNVFPATSRI